MELTTNLKEAKEYIILQLITKEEFTDLKEIAKMDHKASFPYREWNDLFIVCKTAILEPDTNEIIKLLITDIIMEDLGYTEEALFQFATENTPIATGVIVIGVDYQINLFNKMAGILTGGIWVFPEDKLEPVIVTNDSRVNGAALILCDSIMNEIVEHYQTDTLYILPASKDHVIVFPDGDVVDEKYFKSLLYEINRSEFNQRNFLSDNVYKYICETKEFEIV